MIKGVSEVRRIPRLGKIRLGIKKTNTKGVEYPAEVDYFILDPETPDTKRREELIAQFHALYGEKPKSIKIMFPPASPQLFFSQFYKRYGKSTLVKCKGDGEVASTTPEFAEGLEKIGEDDRGFIQVKCLGPDCIYQKSNECSRLASLQVILPELAGVGIWQINTGSYNSIVNINSAIEWLAGLCGRFAMIPITLMRVAQDIQYEGKKSKHYILQIDQDISIGEIQKFALITPVERALIPVIDEKKDELFYDADGKRPSPVGLEEGKIEPDLPGNGNLRPKGEETGPGPEKPKEEAGDPQAKEPGPFKAGMAQFEESKSNLDKMKTAIGTCSDQKSAKAFIDAIKKDGYIDKLLPEHKDELRAWVIAYLKGLKSDIV